LLTGSQHHNKLEPKYPELDAETPSELVDEIAVAEWNRLAPLMIESGHVSTADRASLLTYCTVYAGWRRSIIAAATEPLIIFSKKTRIPHINPVHTLTERRASLLLRATQELGISPSARSRVIAAPVKKAESKRSGLLAG